MAQLKYKEFLKKAKKKLSYESLYEINYFLL